eukprot:TRINITY_DN19893_c0_g1_i1.p1 TRINITY_DN19893_c0_g1~~TRINITY_DN19893_c0_g1_i1.p1  ORF type:complete len:798 (-),score=199.54 TRINITY_DN19893_c0_g1_i1:276-2669(-)
MAPATLDRAAQKEAAKKEATELFLKIGLDQRTAENAVANAKVTANLTSVIHEAGVENGCDKAVGNLLYTSATKFPANALKHRKVFLDYVTSGKIKNTTQVEGGLAFLASVGAEDLDTGMLEEKSGVGVEVTAEEIKSAVSEVIAKERERLLVERYRANVGTLLGHVRAVQPWADGKVAREELDAQLKELLGERKPEDDEKPGKKKKEKKPKAEEVVKEETTVEESNPYAIFPKPQDNIQVHTTVYFSDRPPMMPANSREKLERHLAHTGGRVWTRFPPEPNGFLHIGHAKAMTVDFGFAENAGGDCYLRYDDTNPEAEKKEYIDHIQEIVGWLGWKPFKITYSSDYFQELYDLAVELIKRGHAYVDHQTAEEISEYRKLHKDSPWRNRPVAESLKLFEEMRRGMIDEGKATLRMKQDMRNENFNMYDLIAYRIKFTAHPHAGDKWCIYPSYDYTHCIVDSLENITHSLCTLEFESRRASYFWLLEVLDLYHPYVWEYARLNITNTVLSKRKLNKLVTDHYVNSWDDPRLLTLSGLRRRGASPEAINAFCRAVGITRSDNLIKMELLEHFIREDLNRNSPRTMVVLRPLKVVVKNLEEGHLEELEARSWPEVKDAEPSHTGTYKVPFTRVLYIESSDFRLKDSKDYYGLAPGKTVLLRYAYPIKCTDVLMEADGETVKELHVEYDPHKSTKPKGVIHWVAEPRPGVSPLTAEVRLFDRLFLSENPGELDNWLDDLNPKSCEVVTNAYVVPPLRDCKLGDKFQFERVGYFCVDPDSAPSHLVFNRTVTLRESYPKFAAK